MCRPKLPRGFACRIRLDTCQEHAVGIKFIECIYFFGISKSQSDAGLLGPAVGGTESMR